MLSCEPVLTNFCHAPTIYAVNRCLSDLRWSLLLVVEVEEGWDLKFVSFGMAC